MRLGLFEVGAKLEAVGAAVITSYEYLPTAQNVQAVEPATEYVPVEQGWQEVLPREVV